MPNTNGSLSRACENHVPAKACAPQAASQITQVMRIVRRMRQACAARRQSSTGCSLSGSGGLCLLLPDQFAREAVLQRVRQIEAGQFPGPVRQRQADAELARHRKIDRNRDTELAD